jgi:L-seryl-tRNA(Ser) seleniumtransferase
VTNNPLRELPSVADLCDALMAHGCLFRGAALTNLAKAHVAACRIRLQSGERLSRSEIVADAVALARELARSRFEPAINATGVIIHTNLGRAPLSNAAIEAMSAAAGNLPLELDPETNQRGGRMREISDLMRLLTGAESTLVVNNNAAAVMLVLAAIAAGKSVIVSRGEAVEIGGGFRIHEVMQLSGAHLVDVGATNRTRISDYEAAITGETAAFLRVHASNFTITGFTSSVSIEELTALSVRTGIPVIEDLGSGALIETGKFGLRPEPTIIGRIAAGVDILTASGDKLLGGPQAGIIVGRADLVERAARHPLARAVRADKSCLAALATTLRHYATGTAEAEIPIWRMIAADVAGLRARAELLQQRCQSPTATIEVVETRATVGGGSLPGQTLRSIALACRPESASVDELARWLRVGYPRIFGRIEAERLLLDLRSVLPEHDDALADALNDALSHPSASRGSKDSDAGSGSALAPPAP